MIAKAAPIVEALSDLIHRSVILEIVLPNGESVIGEHPAVPGGCTLNQLAGYILGQEGYEVSSPIEQSFEVFSYDPKTGVGSLSTSKIAKLEKRHKGTPLMDSGVNLCLTAKGRRGGTPNQDILDRMRG